MLSAQGRDPSAARERWPAGSHRRRTNILARMVNLSEKFDEIAGPNGTCLHEVLMRVTRITSAHEYVHHVVNVNLGFIERQIPLCREGPRSQGSSRCPRLVNM